MKKSILILTALSLINCSKPDDNNCNCDGKFVIFGQQGTFTIPNVEIDCKTNKPIKGQNIQENAIFVGCR